MKKFIFVFTLSLVSLITFADKKISGIVVDEKGEPIIGANVQVKDENIGTITDGDGNFSLTVPDDAKTVVVSYIGMQNIEEPIQSVMRITMKENVEMIQEVIATSYGSMSKGSFAGSAQTVDASEIEKKSPSEISKALAGEIAGVQVINTSGQPGTSADIRIRSIGSLNSNSAPLYVVDGMVYEGNIASIDPGDIASTTVLKDATATALYGSRGANGVIVITTKKGNSNEKGKIEVSASYGANMHLLPLYDVISDPKEYVEMAWKSLYNYQYDYINLVNRAGGTNYNPKQQGELYANYYLFSNRGLPAAYNLWQGDPTLLIQNGKFTTSAPIKPQYSKMESWEDALFRKGQKGTANVRISGGNEKMNYYTSLGYLKDEGYYKASDFDRFTVLGRIEFNPRKWLKGGIVTNYAYISMNNPGQERNSNGSISLTNGFYFVNCIPPIYPVYQYNEDGSIQRLANGGKAYDYGVGNGRLFGMGSNPAGLLDLDKQTTTAHNMYTYGYLEFKFYKDLKLEVSAGMQYQGSNESQVSNKYFGDAAGRGYINKYNNSMFFFETKQLLKYNKLIGDHVIDIMAGHEASYQKASNLNGYKADMALPNGLEWSNAVSMMSMVSNSTKYAIESYLVQANYWFKERYGINGTYRADGSSRFAKGHRWGHFGSAGLAWKISNEDFLGSAKNILKDAKIRVSYGFLGDQRLPYLDLYADVFNIVNVEGNVGYRQIQVGNPAITWEKARQLDAGIEFSIKKFLSVELDYFHKTSFDMLMPRYMARSTGFYYMYVNDGKMTNQGFEFLLKANVLDQRNVKLGITLNGSFYRNKIKALPKYTQVTENGTQTVQMTENANMHVGHSYFEHIMYKFAGVDPNNGIAQYVVYYDADKGEYDPNATDIYDATNIAEGATGNNNYIQDVVNYRILHPNATIKTSKSSNYYHAGLDYVGKTSEPDLEGGINIDFEVYGVSLGISCGYRIGGYGYDATYASLMNNSAVGTSNWHVDMRKMWSEENPNTSVPKLNNSFSSYQAVYSDRFLTSNSYFSLNTIRLGYKFPKKLLEKIKFNRLELYVQADNLAIATSRKGYNPMVSFTGRSDVAQYTPLSTIIGGLKFEF